MHVRVVRQRRAPGVQHEGGADAGAQVLGIGRDPQQIEDIWQYLYKGAYWRRGPITMTAIAAVDTAVFRFCQLFLPAGRVGGGLGEGWGRVRGGMGEG